MELKEALRVQTHAEVAEKLRNKCKHQYCHCACNSEIGTFMINYAGGQSAHKKQRRFILIF